MKRSVMSDEAISSLMANTWILTRDCFVADAPRNDKINMRIYNQSLKIFILLILIFFAAANVCLAANLQDAFNTEPDMPLNAAASQGAGFDTRVDVNTIIGFVIKIVLGLIGVIFLVLAIYGGYTWMMARGNEEMVEKAKNTLINAIIGLVVVMAAYAISYFILSQISTKALNSGTSNNSDDDTISCLDDGTCVR